MKSLKSLVITGLLATGLAGTAFANTVQYVYIAGAPAFRQDINTNIAAYVATFSGGGLTATSGLSAGAVDVNYASSNQWLIPNFASGIDLEINLALTGSTAGFESAASGTILQKFIPNGTGSTSSVAVKQSGSETHLPDFVLNDTFQATTPFNGLKTFYAGAGNTGGFTNTYATLSYPKAPSGHPLGIEAYQFVASPGAAAAGLTNITTAQAQALFKNGVLPLAFFTGNNADEGKYVYGLSRDGGSGARLVFQAEVGLGATAPLETYQPDVQDVGLGLTDSYGTYYGGSITDAFDNIPDTVASKTPSTGIWANEGNGGYAKFGVSTQNTGPTTVGLVQAITATPPSGALFVTYLNIPDTTEAVADGAQALTYNGQSFSNTAVYEGRWSFWSYEQLFSNGTLTNNPATVASYLEAHWTAAIPYANLNVSKTADGGIISGNYNYPN